MCGDLSTRRASGSLDRAHPSPWLAVAAAPSPSRGRRRREPRQRHHRHGRGDRGSLPMAERRAGRPRALRLRGRALRCPRRARVAWIPGPRGRPSPLGCCWWPGSSCSCSSSARSASSTPPTWPSVCRSSGWAAHGAPGDQGPADRIPGPSTLSPVPGARRSRREHIHDDRPSGHARRDRAGRPSGRTP